MLYHQQTRLANLTPIRFGEHIVMAIVVMFGFSAAAVSYTASPLISIGYCLVVIIAGIWFLTRSQSRVAEQFREWVARFASNNLAGNRVCYLLRPGMSRAYCMRLAKPLPNRVEAYVQFRIGGLIRGQPIIGPDGRFPGWSFRPLVNSEGVVGAYLNGPLNERLYFRSCEDALFFLRYCAAASETKPVSAAKAMERMIAAHQAAL